MFQALTGEEQASNGNSNGWAITSVTPGDAVDVYAVCAK